MAADLVDQMSELYERNRVFVPSDEIKLGSQVTCRSSCKFEPSGTVLHCSDFVQLFSGKFMLITAILQHRLPSNNYCVWLRGRPLTASESVCFVPGKSLYELAHRPSLLVPAWTAVNLTAFFHECIHPVTRFARCCINADDYEAPRRALVRGDTPVCKVVDVAACAAHLSPAPCSHGCAAFPKSCRIYQCDPTNTRYYHEHWYSRSIHE